MNFDNFKTLASISKSKEFNLFKKYIEFNDFLYYICDNDDKYISQQKVIIDMIFNNNSDEKFIRYCIDSLFNLLFTRPKKIDFFKTIFHGVINELKQRNNSCLSDILNSSKYDQNFIQDIFYSLGINSDMPKDYNKREELLHSLFPQNSLESILMEDKIEELKNYILTNNTFSNDAKLKVRTFSIITDLEKKVPIMSNDYFFSTSSKYVKEINISANLLDFCAFYGSIECFKFLQINGCQFSSNITQFSIAGGNLQIIHIVSENGFSFNNCFRTSVQFHQKSITDWLVSNYACEEFIFTECLRFYDYRSFLFMFLNEADANIEINNQTPLFVACQHENIDIEAFKLFIDNVEDINKGSSSFYSVSPLYALCSTENCDTETIKLLIEKGADVNDGEKNKQGVTLHTPIYALCKNKKVNVDALEFILDKGANLEIGNHSPLFAMCSNHPNLEAMKILLDRGANVNRIDKRWSLSTTPLCDLCSNNADIEVIKLLIEKGADVNKGDLTPLYYLCRNNDINIDAVSFLIEKGADINQKCKDFTGNISTPLLYLSHHPNSSKTQDINNLIRRVQMKAQACAN